MKLYDEIQAEMETKHGCKEFGFTVGILKGSIAEGRKKL